MFQLKKKQAKISNLSKRQQSQQQQKRKDHKQQSLNFLTQVNFLRMMN